LRVCMCVRMYVCNISHMYACVFVCMYVIYTAFKPPTGRIKLELSCYVYVSLYTRIYNLCVPSRHVKRLAVHFDLALSYMSMSQIYASPRATSSALLCILTWDFHVSPYTRIYASLRATSSALLCILFLHPLFFDCNKEGTVVHSMHHRIRVLSVLARPLAFLPQVKPIVQNHAP
jgi:hypothetical protein